MEYAAGTVSQDKTVLGKKTLEIFQADICSVVSDFFFLNNLLD